MKSLENPSSGSKTCLASLIIYSNCGKMPFGIRFLDFEFDKHVETMHACVSV